MGPPRHFQKPQRTWSISLLNPTVHRASQVLAELFSTATLPYVKRHWEFELRRGTSRVGGMDREMSVSCSNRGGGSCSHQEQGHSLWETLRTKVKGFPSLLQAPGPARGKTFSLQEPEQASSEGCNTSRLPKAALSPCQRCSAGGTGGTRPKMPNSQL